MTSQWVTSLTVTSFLQLFFKTLTFTTFIHLMKLTLWAKRRVFYFNNDGLLYVLSYSSYILRFWTIAGFHEYGEQTVRSHGRKVVTAEAKQMMEPMSVSARCKICLSTHSSAVHVYTWTMLQRLVLFPVPLSAVRTCGTDVYKPSLTDITDRTVQTTLVTDQSGTDISIRYSRYPL